MRGAMRIRAVYTESTERASEARRSFYRVPYDESEKKVPFDWPNAMGADDVHFRGRIRSVLDALGVNERVYPANLDVEDVLKLNQTYSHLSVGLMVRAKTDDTPSGIAATVRIGHRQRSDPRILARVRIPGRRIHQASPTSVDGQQPRGARSLQRAQQVLRRRHRVVLVVSPESHRRLPSNRNPFQTVTRGRVAMARRRRRARGLALRVSVPDERSQSKLLLRSGSGCGHAQ